LLSNRFDLAVVLTSNLTNPDIETLTLLRSPRRLWAENSHRFIRRGKATFEEISQEDYIMLTVDEAAHTTMRYWSLNTYQPRVTLRTSSVEAVRSMVANGQGITILSDMVYRPWSLEGRRIGTAATDQQIPSMDVGLAWRKGANLPPSALGIADYFRQSFLSPNAF
jgi:DNA-binding transcriptional LysR family regulator